MQSLIPIHRYCLVGLFLLMPMSIVAQNLESSCLERLRHALHWRNTLPDSGKALSRTMTVTSIARNGDTTVARSTSIEAVDFYLIRSDSAEFWQDTTTLVVVDHSSRTLRIVDLTSRRAVLAARKRVQEMFADSLADHATGIRCEGNEIYLTIPPDLQGFYNARQIHMKITEEGEILRFVMISPPWSPLRSVTYDVEEIDRTYDEIGLVDGVRSRFVDDRGKATEAYRNYRILQR